MVQLPVNNQTQALDVEFDSTRREQLFLFPYESQFKKWEEIILQLYVSLKDKITRHIEREQNWIRSYQQNYAKHMLPGHIQFTLKILDTKRVTLHLYLNLKWRIKKNVKMSSKENNFLSLESLFMLAV